MHSARVTLPGLFVAAAKAVSIPPYSASPQATAAPFAETNLTTAGSPSAPNGFLTIGSPLELVHELHGDFPTANVVTPSGRIFFNLPRSQSDTNATVVEADSFNTERPYPNEAIQHCAPGQNASECFVNVQSLDIDSTLNRLWVLDTGTPPNSMEAVPYGAKIMSFNLTTNQMERNYVLPNDMSKGGTSINDIRLNLTQGTEGTGFISDEQGSLITLDLASGEYIRRFYKDEIVSADPQFVGFYDGVPELYMWKNNTRSHLTTGCDGVAVAGGWLYFAPSASRRLYRVPQDVVSNRNLADGQVKQQVQALGDYGTYSGGFDSDDAGRVYITTAAQNSIIYLNTSLADLTPSQLINDQTEADIQRGGTVAPQDVQFGTLVRDARIQWPDSIYVTTGYLYITVNELPLSPGYSRGNVDRRTKPYRLYRTYTGTNHA